MPLPNRIPKISRFLAREHIRSRLQSWIVEGALRPEEVLNDKEIAVAFGVSRMPVREALRSLEDQGLIETALNRWTRVAPLQAHQAQHLYEVLAALEASALRDAYRDLSRQDFETLERAINDLHQAIAASSALDAARADLSFHSVWVRRAGNPELERIVMACRTKLMRIELAYFRSPADMGTSCSEHKAIVGALKSKDLSLSLLRLEEHWRASVERCMSHVHLLQTRPDAAKSEAKERE